MLQKSVRILSGSPKDSAKHLMIRHGVPQNLLTWCSLALSVATCIEPTTIYDYVGLPPITPYEAC